MQFFALGVAFLLSGTSALLFETLWLRMCGLVFGNAVVSVALILSSFMAGLALGGAIAASRLFSKRRALRTYAGLEIAIGALGLSLVLLLPNIGAWLRPLFRLLSDHAPTLNLIRFAGAFAIFVLPATAMGLTLPVAVSDPVFETHQFRSALATFYAANTIGAVIGTIIGEAYLVRAFGISGTAFVAMTLNLFAAAIGFTIAGPDRQSPPPVLSGHPSRFVQGRVVQFLIVSFGTGAILLSLEVVWFRFLRLYIASTATAFAIMLGVVLAGMAAGAIAAALFRHARSRVRPLLANLLLLAALVTLATYVFFPISILQRFAASWHDFILDTWKEITIVSIALMFPTAFVSGILFPLTTDAIESAIGQRRSSVGMAALLNTVGAAIGPLSTSFLLLPIFGFQNAIIVCATLYVTLAFALAEWSRFSIRDLPTLALIAIFAFTLIFFPYGRSDEHFAHARQPFETDGSRLISKREGNSDTWQLLCRDLYGQPYYCRLLTNAFSMSSTQYPNQRYMRLFAYLPLTLQPSAQQALLICYGCGVTADALTQDRQLRHIDVVDLSKEVLELANYYPRPNPLRDSRVRSFVQDGRFFLQATTRKYDVITGEPPPPKVTGTVNIYTQEFFQLMHDALNDGGIATFWLPIYQLNVTEIKAILHGFRNAFPNASLWASSDDEWIMMGINGSTSSLDQQQAERLWQNPETRADLARIGFEKPEQLAALFVMDAPEIERITGGTPPLTDQYPKRLTDARVDRNAVHDFSLPYIDGAAATRRFRASEFMSRLWPNEFQDAVGEFFVVREFRYRSQIGGSNRFAELDFYLRHSHLRLPVLEVLGADEYRIALAQKTAQSTSPTPNDILPDLVADALAARDFARAIGLLEHERAQGIAASNDLLLLIYARCFNGDVEGAERVAAETHAAIASNSARAWLFGMLQAEFGFRPPS